MSRPQWNGFLAQRHAPRSCAPRSARRRRASADWRGAVAHHAERHIALRRPRRPDPATATATAPAPRSARPPALHQRQQRRRPRAGPVRVMGSAGQFRGGRRDAGGLRPGDFLRRPWHSTSRTAFACLSQVKSVSSLPPCKESDSLDGRNCLTYSTIRSLTLVPTVASAATTSCGAACG